VSWGESCSSEFGHLLDGGHGGDEGGGLGRVAQRHRALGEVAAVGVLPLVVGLDLDAGRQPEKGIGVGACGHGRMFSGPPTEGLVDTQEALDLARRLGYAEGEAMVLWHHAEVLAACGHAEEALTAAESGVELARQLGHRGATVMTLLGLGVARLACGDFEGSDAAFEECIDNSGDQLTLFGGWSHARLALPILDRGRIGDAALHVAQALSRGPELSQYEARFAQCTLAVTRGDEESATLVDDALRRAVAGGHETSASRLRELSMVLGHGG